MNTTNRQALAAFVDWYENLTPQTLEDIAMYYTDDLHFRDPFHEFSNRDSLYHVYRNMFTTLDRPRFHIDATITDGNESALYWRFLFHYGRREMTITGSSRICLAADGRVTSHIDYWDAAHQVYERIPLLGALLRTLRRRLARTMLQRRDDAEPQGDTR